jgi:hypothetical protein
LELDLVRFATLNLVLLADCEFHLILIFVRLQMLYSRFDLRLVEIFNDGLLDHVRVGGGEELSMVTKLFEVGIYLL